MARFGAYRYAIAHEVLEAPPGGTGEGFGSPVLGVKLCPEFEFWAVASGITGRLKRPPVTPRH